MVVSQKRFADSNPKLACDRGGAMELFPTQQQTCHTSRKKIQGFDPAPVDFVDSSAADFGGHVLTAKNHSCDRLLERIAFKLKWDLAGTEGFIQDQEVILASLHSGREGHVLDDDRNTAIGLCPECQEDIMQIASLTGALEEMLMVPTRTGGLMVTSPFNFMEVNFNQGFPPISQCSTPTPYP